MPYAERSFYTRPQQDIIDALLLMAHGHPLEKEDSDAPEHRLDWTRIVNGWHRLAFHTVEDFDLRTWLERIRDGYLIVLCHSGKLSPKARDDNLRWIDRMETCVLKMQNAEQVAPALQPLLRRVDLLADRTQVCMAKEADALAPKGAPVSPVHKKIGRY